MSSESAAWSTGSRASPSTKQGCFASWRPRATRRRPALVPEKIARMVEDGTDLGDATCGMVEVAGVSVPPRSLALWPERSVIGDVLRHLHGGREVGVVSLDLRSPAYLDAAENTTPGPFFNPGRIAAR